MTGKTKNAHPCAATREWATETRAPGQATHISHFENSTANQRKQYCIESLLLHGAENALSTADLVRLAGCETARQLQKDIAFERAHGALILSSTTGGYFLPDCGEKGRRELLDYVRTLHARAFNTLKAAKYAKAALRLIDGQVSLDLGGVCDGDTETQGYNTVLDERQD